MTTKKWLNCRLRDLQATLVERGQRVSLPVISRLLKAQDYRLHVNRKEAEGPATLSESSNLPTSMRNAKRISRLDSLVLVWIPKRRNSSGISRMLAGSGVGRRKR